MNLTSAQETAAKRLIRTPKYLLKAQVVAFIRAHIVTKRTAACRLQVEGKPHKHKVHAEKDGF